MFELGIDLAVDGPAITLGVTGEIDLATAPQLLEAIQSAAAGPGAAVTVDLGGVTFLDSAGIAALLAARRDVDALDRTFSIRNPQPAVRMALRMSGVEEVLNVEDGDAASPGLAS